jgi:type II secretory pathway component GspD/PulD (secretin)
MQGQPSGGVVPASAQQGVTGLQGQPPTMAAPTPVAQAPAAPSTGDNLAAQVKAMQDIEYQRLRQEGLDIQSEALKKFERGETDAALESLETYLKKVKGAKLDSASVARLERPIDQKIQNFKLLKAQKDFETNVGSSRAKFNENKRTEMVAEEKKQQQVKELMKQFNQLYKEGKYREAEQAAAKAHELDPDDPTIALASQMAPLKGAVDSYEDIVKRNEQTFLRNLNSAHDMGPPVDDKNPIYFDKDPVRLKYAQGRAGNKGGVELKSLSDKEKAIQAMLSRHLVSVNFHNVPLSKALSDLQAMTGVNIVLRHNDLKDEGINPDQPVSLDVNNIALKSALKILVDSAHLTYVVGDEVVNVTTEAATRGKNVTKIYSVADLVIPIDDYMLPAASNTLGALERIVQQQGANLGAANTPFNNSRQMLPQGQAVGNGTNSTLRTSDTLPGGVQPGGGSAMGYSASVSPTKVTIHDKLINLIQNCISPQSWSAVGGAGTIDYFPTGLALVINQTMDVQEQVADLLEALRRLQDLEVAVEVRMITLAETFFERIGLDFALNLKTDKATAQYEPQLVSSNFKPAGFVNDFSPGRFIAGLSPAQNAGPPGNFTSDLDIPIRATSFQYAIPGFGGYPNNPGFNGGLSLGLAFLSDIQVFMFMEAAQGDRRTNVMQAPKLTLFNGQTATITVNDNQFFVSAVSVVGFGGQIVFVPTNTPIPLGVSLTIQAVVSADRRFVRLNITPTLSNLNSAIVPLFPITTFITPVFEGGAQGQPVPFTQFIQQPNISTITIQTTVSIPDGGTVILGGLKTLSEGRNEFGPPVLSKIPYLSRLVKNTGYGREAQSLLIMVTPRIIINSEEEERQTGVIVNPAIQ